jgi:hypothetical protein
MTSIIEESILECSKNVSDQFTIKLIKLKIIFKNRENRPELPALTVLQFPNFSEIWLIFFKFMNFQEKNFI